MRLLFFRHGDPDYVNDALTDKGKKEAELLAKTIESFNLDDIYLSPLGRARATADYSLKVLGRETVVPVSELNDDQEGLKTHGNSPVICDWLKEFPALFDANIADEKEREAYITELQKDESTGLYRKRIVWDMLPSYYGKHPELFDVNEWRNSDLVKASDMTEVYDYVISEFDALMAKYGYERDGSIYNVKESNEKILGFFCHFGITSIILSHLWNVSPFMPMQFLAMAPTSVTELVTEERQKGIAIFRTLRIGDISHLVIGGEEPSFSARFCERYENENERH